ncbi:MAG: hypothetical protein AAGC44_06575 [Planctomycetota bacterium]
MSEAREPFWPVRLWRTPLRDLVRFRVSCRLDWRGLIAESSVPGQVKGVVTKLVRRTRLWRLEKASIARELLAHFEDALANGQSPEHAIELFGDWRKTAKLIRRATKRKRGYLWHAWRFSFWSAAALVGCYVGLGLYYMTGSPNVAVDYLPMINERALAVPEDERAWPVVREALLAMGAGESENRTQDIAYAELSGYDLMVSQPRPGDARWGDAVAFCEAHTGPLSELRRAAQMPGLGYIAGYGFYDEDRALVMPEATDEAFAAQVVGAYEDPQMLWAVVMPHLGYMRTCARLLGVEAFVAAEHGDAQRAYTALQAALQYGRFANEQNTLINQLVDISVCRLNLYLTSELLAYDLDLFNEQQLRELAHELDRIRSYRIDLSGERMHFMDTIQHIYTDDGNGNGHLDAQAWRRFTREMSGQTTAFYDTRNRTGSEYLFDYALSPGATLYAADRMELADMANHIYNLLEQDMATPIWERPQAITDQAVKDLMLDAPLPWPRYGLLTELVPAVTAVRSTAHRYMAQADATRAAIALELYRHEEGVYPDTLGQLVPRYLPEVPIDRMTGGPMLYRVGEDGPVLYSVGADRDDDGGQIAYDPDDPDYRSRDVQRWTVPDGEAAFDGDWVLWPLHDERKPVGLDKDANQDPA